MVAPIIIIIIISLMGTAAVVSTPQAQQVIAQGVVANVGSGGAGAGDGGSGGGGGPEPVPASVIQGALAGESVTAADDGLLSDIVEGIEDFVAPNNAAVESAQLPIIDYTPRNNAMPDTPFYNLPSIIEDGGSAASNAVGGGGAGTFFGSGGGGGSSAGGGGGGGGGPVPVVGLDLTAPVVFVTFPKSGDVLPAGTAKITPTGTATDNKALAVVQGSVNGSPFTDAAKVNTSWSIDILGLQSGQSYTLTMKAHDGSGNTGQASVTFSVANASVPNPEPDPDTTAPTVVIVFPLNNGAVTGTVKGVATATDNVGIAKLIGFIDNTQLNTENEAPYEFDIASNSYPNGNHVFKVVAHDTNGNTAQATKTISINNNNNNPNPNPPPLPGTDIFGITKIHPTKVGGDEWSMDMTNPNSDVRFDPQNSITKNADGSWKMTSSQVRMNVLTKQGYHPERITSYDQTDLAAKGYMQDSDDWKNIEMTGYVKVNAASDDNLSWYARGGIHIDSDGGCEGTSYKGDLDYSGDVRFAKEQQHPDGYSFSSWSDATTSSVKGRWIGFKTVMYNDAKGDVVLQLFLNNNGDKTSWVKVYDIKDDGGWGSDGDKCGGTPDQKITWGGPISTFRWDSASDVDFKWLSVREIKPNPSVHLELILNHPITS